MEKLARPRRAPIGISFFHQEPAILGHYPQLQQGAKEKKRKKQRATNPKQTQAELEGLSGEQNRMGRRYVQHGRPGFAVAPTFTELSIKGRGLKKIPGGSSMPPEIHKHIK